MAFVAFYTALVVKLITRSSNKVYFVSTLIEVSKE